MRLRRAADKVRTLGFALAVLAVILAVINLQSFFAGDVITLLPLMGSWALPSGSCYAIAWLMDRRAEKVVTR